MNQSREPATFQHVCVIATEQIRASPMLDDAEWKARIKDRLIALGFTYPESMDGIERAMRAVERALTREWGPRPSPATPKALIRTEHLEQLDPPWRKSRTPSPAWNSLQTILQTLRPSATSNMRSDGSHEEPETAVRRRE